MRNATRTTRVTSLKKTSALALTVASVMSCSVSGATLVWDANGTGAAGTEAAPTNVGGTNPWDTSSNTWYSYTTPGYQTWTNTGSDMIANLAGTAGTLTIGASTTINVNRINVATSGYIISGADATSVLNFDGATPTIATSGNSLTINAAISGGTVITKTGTGALVLNGANTFTGGFTYSETNNYVLRLGNASALGTGTLTLSGSGNRAEISTVGTTDRAYTNAVTTSKSEIRFGDTGLINSGRLSLGSFTNTAGNQSLNVYNTSTTLASYTSGGGTISKGIANPLIVTGNWNQSGSTALNVNAGALAVAGTYSNSGSSANLSGGVLGRNGTISAALGAVQSAKWATTANGGLFAFGSNATWGNASNNLTVDFASIGTAGSPLVWASTSNFVADTRTLILGNVLSNGTVTMLDAISLNNAARTIQVDKGATNTSGADAVLAGIVSNGSLVKTGDGTLRLGAVNTYAGNTTVANGTLQLADDARLVFAIGATGINNKITSDAAGDNGMLSLLGDFSFDLTLAGSNLGDSWTIVDIGSDLVTTFGSTFNVVGFTSVGSAGSRTWTGTANSATYQFTESDGVLSVVPEPTSLALLGLSGVALLGRRGRGSKR